MAAYSPESNGNPNITLSIGQLKIALVGMSVAVGQVTPKGMSRIIGAVGGSSVDAAGSKVAYLGTATTFDDTQGQITLKSEVDNSVFLVFGV